MHNPCNAVPHNGRKMNPKYTLECRIIQVIHSGWRYKNNGSKPDEGNHIAGI